MIPRLPRGLNPEIPGCRLKKQTGGKLHRPCPFAFSIDTVNPKIWLTSINKSAILKPSWLAKAGLELYSLRTDRGFSCPPAVVLISITAIKSFPGNTTTISTLNGMRVGMRLCGRILFSCIQGMPVVGLPGSAWKRSAPFLCMGTGSRKF